MRNSILAQSLQKSLDKSKAATEPSVPPPFPAPDGPKALRSMAEVLASVSEQAPQEVDPSEIASSEISDRFDVQEGLDELIASIRDSGQQLAVMLRHRTGLGPRYEVVYGRRRIAACRALGIKVNAYIKDMSLDDALMSQALENSARLERSFIEQAVFAVRLEDAGFSSERICQALAIDASTISRLRSVVRDIPEPLIRRIGAAPGIGRRPWMELRELVKASSSTKLTRVTDTLPEGGTAAERLDAAIRGLLAKEQPQSSGAAVKRALPDRKLVSGSVSYRTATGSLVLKADRKQDRGFLEYLESRLNDLYEDWSNPTK